jgi:hypothetical protein
MPGIWNPLTNEPPFAASTMFLLTDGTVMCQESGGMNWWKLTPDAFGDYMHGTWSALAPMHFTRLYYASAVLKDGRVLVAGGEYSNGGSETNKAEIYDPALDSWTEIAPPPGWVQIGDASCSLLPDGRFFLGNIDDTRTAIYDPETNLWTAGASKDDRSSEESWLLLPDQTILSVECTHHPKAEKYVAPGDIWVSAGTLPQDLVEAASIEIGPAILLPDGRVFNIGATGHNALYTPPALASQPGSWNRGPDFPKDATGRTLGAKDAPACLMPNGHVLCVAGPVTGKANDFLGPTSFFEFDGTSLQRVQDPPNAGGPPFVGRMMLLPTGQVLFANGSNAIYLFTPAGGPEPDWRPAITAHPLEVRPLHTYTLHGRQLNGLSQAVGYGDDSSAATNYPLVRLRHIHTGQVRYCRTFDHSTMGVATGTILHSTQFRVPLGLHAGEYEMVVVANGIASCPVFICVEQFRLTLPLDEAMVNFLIGSLADGPLWVLGPNGPVPVDPWGPEVAKEATEARRAVIQGLKELQTLGARVAKLRAKTTAMIPPSVDAEYEAALIKTGGKKETQTTKARV